MRPQSVGAIEVRRIPDLEDAPFGRELFPDASDAIIRAQGAVLGSRYIDAEKAKLLFSFHAFLVRTPHHTILVDTCIGNDKERPARPGWHRRQGDFLARLAAAGARPEDIDYVLCTHMHADHVGWNTRLDGGRWRPTFTRAQYLMVESEYTYWRTAESHHGSFADSVLPVIAAGQATMVASDHAVSAGITLIAAPGHTPGNVMIALEDDGRRILLGGDVVHHPIQMAYPQWSSAACVDPDLSRRTRLALLDDIADHDIPLLSAHFQAPTAGRVVRDGGAYRFLFDH